MIAVVAVMVFACAGGVCWLRMRRYGGWFRLPRRRDDVLTIRGSDRAVDVIIRPDGFDVPAGLDLAGRTVLLQLKLKARLPGHWLDPYIEIRHDGRMHRQYFERGAAGQRYVNLSPVFQGSDGAVTHVELHGAWICWGTSAALLAFDKPALDGAKVLVLAPHPDDAEIASFGVYAGSESWVVTLTAGELATGHLPVGIPAPERSKWTAWLRVWDCLSVPSLGNVPPERRLNLAYPDGALRSMHREPARLFQLGCEASLPRRELRALNKLPQFQSGTPGCSWPALVDDLRALLDLIQPDIVVCPHPLVDTHSDHIFTALALEHAIREFKGKSPQLFLYVVHSGGSPMHPLGPADSLVSVPPGQFPGWAADSLYSHPLEPQRRQAKYFAIEAMHVGRNYAIGAGPGGGWSILKATRTQISAYLAGMEPHPESLLRRAPRPNEMYYVLRADLLSDLTRRMNL